ncbi:MAG: glycoside hydrolase family 3 C-terminal domain-containing protein, partial [Muribaculaceae bacterium]|nr:glycoside hydrolase family 3 C-terminal domain-containing protein [Muribaculaceae bacterium]
MKWLRHQYQPCKPLGADGRVISGSEAHIELSRKAAAESIVLLKNEEEALPLKHRQKVVLLGKASEEYIKGGGGSGDVTAAYVRNLYQGMKLKEAEGKVQVYDGLHDFYEADLKRQYADHMDPGMTVEPKLSEEQWKAAAAFADTAVISICRFSGEGWDRRCRQEKEMAYSEEECETWEGERRQREIDKRVFQNGDFQLSNEEKDMVETAKTYFRHLIVILNVGGVVDTSWFVQDSKVEAALFAGQCGMEGGLAEADILCGDVNPSGKLVDTFAASLEDYPSTEGFHDSAAYVEYIEDIYVGYRYFETIPGKQARVNYPFGYGMSYTEFAIRIIRAEIEREHVSCYAAVRNVGRCAGKEVLQLYYHAPEGKLGKPAIQLADFQKTKLLEPGEEEVWKLEFPLCRMASYDDCGKVQKSAYVLEEGIYRFYLGTSVRELKELPVCYELEEDQVTEQLTQHLAPGKLSRRMRQDGSLETLEVSAYEVVKRPESFKTPKLLEGVAPEVRFEKRETLEEHFHPSKKQFIDVAEGKLSLEAFMEDLSIEEMVYLLGGQPSTGVANTFGIGNNREHHIPNIMTADGPAGLRILPWCEIHTTAWPCATMLACTWNREIVKEVGQAAALEVKENNIGIWLAPGMNIHRSPLCGRNFEYYSEDPVVTGEIGTAMVQGIQSQHIAATPKHFAMNNKETNRKHSDSIVSERAAREIYLKG